MNGTNVFVMSDWEYMNMIGISRALGGQNKHREFFSFNNRWKYFVRLSPIKFLFGFGVELKVSFYYC